MSASQVRGAFDYNRTSLSPPGTHVLVHEQQHFKAPGLPLPLMIWSFVFSVAGIIAAVTFRGRHVIA
jgi:hypothetical protein